MSSPRGRTRPGDPSAYVFDPRPGAAEKFFEPAIERAQAALSESGKDVSRIEGYVWHSNRHTSRHGW